MAKCTFCNKQIEKGTGKIFVFNTSKIANFCSNKCEKNLLKLKRNPIKFKWTREKKKND
ncbi:50S ribosomal protein L24e [archaeon]|mgnify:FL=1|jgi:large subunit ribosomal protein L24e|nr:50S ribosomal protein L24e [archaeon]MBT6824344.1 50S ribosomal protein L24e [archaeon]MBT7106894.1 50S ribosomal protein L24e [archaeon]MBT7297447.1 50S ribosomal protein L24e [archaeon]